MNPVMWSPGMSLAVTEKLIILNAYQHYQKNKVATSNSLGISVRTLDAKLAKYAKEEELDEERKTRQKQEADEFLKRARGNYTHTTHGAQVITAGSGVSNPQDQVPGALANQGKDELL